MKSVYQLLIISLVTVVVGTGCSHNVAAYVGKWTYEQDRTYGELSLNEDGSCSIGVRNQVTSVASDGVGVNCTFAAIGNRISIKEARLSDDAQESSSDTLQIIYLPETDELLLMVEPAIRLSRENPGDG